MWGQKPPPHPTNETRTLISFLSAPLLNLRQRRVPNQLRKICHENIDQNNLNTKEEGGGNIYNFNILREIRENIAYMKQNQYVKKKIEGEGHAQT